MFFSGRALSRLQDQVHDLERIVADLRTEVAKLDPVELERIRNSALNAIRSLRRLQASEKDPEEVAGPNGTPPTSAGPWWARRG